MPLDGMGAWEKSLPCVSCAPTDATGCVFCMKNLLADRTGRAANGAPGDLRVGGWEGIPHSLDCVHRVLPSPFSYCSSPLFDLNSMQS